MGNLPSAELLQQFILGAAKHVTVLHNSLPQNQLWTVTILLPMVLKVFPFIGAQRHRKHCHTNWKCSAIQIGTFLAVLQRTFVILSTYLPGDLALKDGGGFW